MTTDIVKDVSKLSTIPEKTLNKFFKKMVYCICDAVDEYVHSDSDELLQLNIGLGTLYVKVIGRAVKYHFEPSDYLEKSLGQTIEQEENVLSESLTDSLSKKFMEVYKDLC